MPADKKMSQQQFLRKALVERIRYVYENGIFITDTIFNQYRVHLILVEGNCLEMFVDLASLDIASISPLDHGSIRMRRYSAQVFML